MNAAWMGGLLLLGLLLSLCCSGDALAQGALPATGADVRVGDLRGQFEQAFGGLPTVQAHTWTYQPSLGLSETFDDGVILRNGKFATDLITSVTPGINITGDSSRLTGTLFYAPALNVYAINGNLNSVAQNLNAELTATIVPDLFFVDLRGYATQEAIQPGYGQAGAVATNGQEAQNISFSITPRLQHRFGGVGTAILSDTLTRNMVSALGGNTLNTAFADGNFTSNEVNTSFSTGENFGRINNTLSAMALQYQGTGALLGAHREIFNDAVTYAFSRLIAGTASFGHEDIAYGPGGPAPITGVTWSGGVQITPNENTNISISYGHQQGSTDLTLDSSFAPTARTRVYARYSHGVGTQQEEFLKTVVLAGIGPNGILIDPTTGAPLTINNFFGFQTDVFKTTRATLTGVILYARDTITVNLEHDEQTELAGGVANGGDQSGSGISGSVAWSHIISDALSTSTFMQYGTRSFTAGGNQTDLLLTLSVNYAISQTLGATFQYTRSQISGATFGQPASRDIATVSLHKLF